MVSILIASPGVDIFEDLEEACKGVDVAILLSGVRPGGGREQVMARTVDLYRSIGAALEQHANRDVKVSSPVGKLANCRCGIDSIPESACLPDVLCTTAECHLSTR